MPFTPPLIGVIGKTNVGKSTFFSAATLVSVEISNRPFTTIEPNVGIGYVKRKCVHMEFNVRCSPRNSICLKGYRFIPVRMIDVAGLIPGSHMGRGLGNKFMDELRQADVLIHVVDASGSTDPEGNPARPGTYNPVDDVRFVEEEVDRWFFAVIKRSWDKISRALDAGRHDPVDLLTQRLSGLSVRRSHIVAALNETGLVDKKYSLWSDDDLYLFSSTLRRMSKPMVIAANKADIPEAEDFIRELVATFKDRVIVPVSAEAELALRRAARAGLIEYLPGDPSFEITDKSKLTPKQLKALEYIRERVLNRWGSTGVQEVLNKAVFDVLGMIVVYPVEDAAKLTDHHGNVLPDAYIVRRGTKARELAYMIHSELGDTFLYALDARSKARLGEDYILKDGDVIKVVATMAKR